MAHTVDEMIEKYVAAWNYNSLEEFKQAFTEVWAVHAEYTDPNFPLVKGVKGISELAQFSLEKIPGRKFSVVIPPQYHNQACLYTWGVDIPGIGKREGQDYIEFNEVFKITRLISFFKPF
jgi:hypothetical protein